MSEFRKARSFRNIIEKFNPYHDRLGRFTTSGGATSFTYSPGKSLAHDLAIEREKTRMAGVMPTEAQAKTLKTIETKTRNLKKEQFRVVDREGNVIFQKQGDGNSVSYKIGEARDNFPGNITVHNHPDGGTFSSSDLSDIGHGATEIRAAAPEGTYILRNTRYGTKWNADAKTWFDMRNDLDAASQDFKNDRQLKKQVRENNAERYAKEVQPIVDKWAKRKSEGADWDELNAIAKNHEKASATLNADIKKEVRAAYVNQYHEWYKSNAHKYGLEYEFVPVNKRVKKSIEGEWMFTDSITKSDDNSGEIVLDAQMNKDIEDITAEIMDSFKSDMKKSFTFNEAIEKFNPYHDRLGRFTSGSGFGIGGSFYTGDRDRQAVIFSANPETKAGRLAIERHGGTMTAAYDDKPVEPTGPGTKKLSLDQAAIKRADDNSLMGTAGTSRAKEAQRRVDDFKEEFKEKSEWTDEQKAYVKQRQDEYTDLVSEYYNDQIRRTGENVSWAVAGPANYNYARHDKKMNAQMNRANEYEEKLQRFKDNTYKKLESMTPEDQQIARWRNGKWKNGETIDAADPLAEKKLQAKLDYLNENQQKMKDANAYYRRNKTMTGYEGFSEKTNENINRAMEDAKSRGWSDNKPFASYSLTNNNAQIKATQSRLTQIQSNKAKAAAESSSGSGSGSGGRTFNGGSVVRNTEINRLQIKFDSIPDAATRQQLKSNGWKWSPRNQAWQRQLTDNAERSADRLIESFGKSRTPPVDGEKAIFIGLNVSGADELAIQGGEDPKEFHVTLLYGYHNRQSDIEDIACCVQEAVGAIRPMIPDELHLDKIDTFEPSESSDQKKVVIARVKAGQLEAVHEEFLKQMKKSGLEMHETFSEYNPHMTLAYVDPEADVSIREINKTVKVTNLTIGIEDEEGSTQENAYKVKKSDSENTFQITKADSDKRLVFGWANIATRANGEVIQDWQDDIVEPEDLEEAVYEYVLNFRDSGEEHIPTMRKKGRMVESVVFTEEKLEAMGIPKGTVPLGWWIGFYIDDDEAWEKVKDGTYKMFSVEGQGKRVPVEDLETRMRKSAEPVAKTFSHIIKL